MNILISIVSLPLRLLAVGIRDGLPTTTKGLLKASLTGIGLLLMIPEFIFQNLLSMSLLILGVVIFMVGFWFLSKEK